MRTEEEAKILIEEAFALLDDLWANPPHPQYNMTKDAPVSLICQLNLTAREAHLVCHAYARKRFT